MTEKEALYELIRNLPEKVFGTELYCEAYDIALKELEKMDKYRWHDLRKDPDDHPHDNVTVLCCVGKGYYIIATAKKNTGFAHLKWHKVIAWRYIDDPFEEVPDD